MFKKVISKPASQSANDTPTPASQLRIHRATVNRPKASQPEKDQMPQGQTSQTRAPENLQAENNAPESRLAENKLAAPESFLERYPGAYLTIMLMLMLASAGYLLSKTSVFSANQRAPISYSGPLNESFEGIFTSSNALRELINIKTQIDNILSKDSLSQRDSVVIEHALSRFEQIQHELGWTASAGTHIEESDKHTTP